MPALINRNKIDKNLTVFFEKIIEKTILNIQTSIIEKFMILLKSLVTTMIYFRAPILKNKIVKIVYIKVYKKIFIFIDFILFKKDRI